MAYLSREEFLKAQQERQERANAPRQTQSQTRVGFFGLKNDGDEAIVRFAYSNPDEIEVFTTHAVTIDGKFRKVNCLRTFKDPIDNCPLCAAGQSFQQRVYIKLIEYVRNEDGSITPTPKVWERSASYVQILTNLFTEYGDISDCIFKIKRSGAKGDVNTTYSILFGNPSIYNSQLYPKDFSAFENYKILGGPLMDKNYNELKELVSDAAEVPTQHQTFTPQASQPQPQSQQFTGQRVTY
jgi:hypothetical protein